MLLIKNLFSQLIVCFATISLAGPSSTLSDADPVSVRAAYIIGLPSFPKEYSAAK